MWVRQVLVVFLSLAAGWAFACNETVLLYGGNPYREASTWPVLADRPEARSTLVLVGSRMEANGPLYKAAFEGPSTLNGFQTHFPAIDNLTLDISRIPHEETLIEAINHYARSRAIVQFAAHSNEEVVEINSTTGRVFLKPEHWARLELEDKIVILTGCKCGQTEQPPEKRLMDRLMADTNARAVLGMKRFSFTSGCRIYLPDGSGGHDLVSDETLIDDFLTPIWFVHLQGGTYRNPPIYHPYDSMDLEGAFERDMAAQGLVLPPWDVQLPELPEVDPLTQWRILERIP